MKRVIGVLLMIILISGCKSNEVSSNSNDMANIESISNQEPVMQPVVLDYETDGLKSFIGQIEERGYSGDHSDGISQGPLGAKRIFTFDGENAFVFEYETSDQMKMDLKNIGDGGYSYTRYYTDGKAITTNTEWIDSVHYYTYENLIIRYVGGTIDIINDLEDICGNQIFQVY